MLNEKWGETTIVNENSNSQWKISISVMSATAPDSNEIKHFLFSLCFVVVLLHIEITSSAFIYWTVALFNQLIERYFKTLFFSHLKLKTYHESKYSAILIYKHCLRRPNQFITIWERKNLKNNKQKSEWKPVFMVLCTAKMQRVLMQSKIEKNEWSVDF